MNQPPVEAPVVPESTAPAAKSSEGRGILNGVRTIGRRLLRRSALSEDEILAKREEQFLRSEGKLGSIKEQWDTFMFEINGTGFRWEFDHDTKDPAAFRRLYSESRTFAEHRRDPEALEARVRKFGRYVDKMEGYVGHPVAEKPSYGGGTHTIEIPPELIPIYKNFTRALAAYTRAVEHHYSADDIADAAMAVCRIVRPLKGQKPQPGDMIDLSEVTLTDSMPRLYLEELMRQGEK